MTLPALSDDRLRAALDDDDGDEGGECTPLAFALAAGAAELLRWRQVAPSQGDRAVLLDQALLIRHAASGHLRQVAAVLLRLLNAALYPDEIASVYKPVAPSAAELCIRLAGESDYAAGLELAGNIRAVLAGSALDQLRQLVATGPVWDGDVISKSDRDELIRLGLATRVMVGGAWGWTAATYLGGHVLGETLRPEPTRGSECSFLRVMTDAEVAASDREDD
jgi:hypothetical protein